MNTPLPSASDHRPRRMAALLCALLFSTAFPSHPFAQSLWTDNSVVPLAADKRARSVGDILTILVHENSSATKDNQTTTAKKTGVDASISTFLYGPKASGFLTRGGQYPALKFDAKHDYSGGGKINNTERIIARIAVRVVDVLPNENLVIEGTRETSFARETQHAVLRGVVRAEDVTAQNTLFSYNIANATITYISKGAVSDAQRKGWFTRVWDKLSPF
jgi:flagellar L-ring protein FlgH